MHLVENTAQLAEARRLWARAFGCALCSGAALYRAPTKWLESVSMFTSLSVTSVLILIQGRTPVESSSQGSQRSKQWKSSWLPSARKGPLEALSDWMGQGSHDHPWEGCPLPLSWACGFCLCLGEPQPHMDPMREGCVLVLIGSVMSDFLRTREW